MERSVGTFGYRGRAHFGELRGNVDPNGFKLTNVSGGRMKRNFSLLTLAAAGMWLLAAAPAFATCPAGFTGTALAAGTYAVKIEGFVTDTGACSGGSTCPDPTPKSEGGFGTIKSDGACDIIGGDIIFGIQGGSGITSPATFPELGPIPTFGGTASSANDVGTYQFDSNSTGEIVIADTPSGQTWAFGIQAELGNTEFRGARINPGDPLVILIEKQAAVTAAQFLNQDAVTFDAAGGGSAGGALGVGFDAVGVSVTEHLDPETGTTAEGGGTIFFNVDNGYDSTVIPGVQVIPPGGGALVCDFHETVLQQNAGSGQDGTQLTNASVNADYSCPLGGAAFTTASVLYGSSNGNAFIATVGTNGTASPALAIGEASRAIIPGAPIGGASVLVASVSNPHPSHAVVVTNSATEPLDWTSLGITVSSGPADVTIEQNSSCTGAGAPYACCTGTGTGTCGTCPAIGDLAAFNPLFPKPTCTVLLVDSGATCTTGTPEVGTLNFNGADHAMTGATASATAENYSVKCQ